MEVQEVDDFFEHFGVKGMRWGIRRNRNNTTTRQSLRPKKEQTDLSKMSDAELRTRINRIQMERQYRELTSPKGHKVQTEGQKYVKRILIDTAMNAVAEIVKEQYKKQMVNTGAAMGSKLEVWRAAKLAAKTLG